ncbi:MAG: ABC transporter ATP-binding protein [Desulfobacteraceae bacterium]|jgi:iron complex transport system ATP-binding protein|nr:ABC transporter ATP-binding protein [Desulfobacteraceae bacterium]
MSFELNHISFNYAERKVIDNISLALVPGKLYGIIGPNGSGKTTLLDLLARHKLPDEGNISYQGKTLSSFSKKELSKKIALVPQNFYINFPFTVKEIVMMGRYPHIPRFAAPSSDDLNILQNVMQLTEISEFSDRYITELSGGERQRVIFARALAQDTPVLILDEATSNLDINFSINLLNIAAQRVKTNGNTVVAVMQDINLAAGYCDYLIFMSGGKIAAHGDTQIVLNPDTLRTVFNIEAKVYHEPYSRSLQVVFKK